MSLCFLVVLFFYFCFFMVYSVFTVSLHEPQNSNSATGDIEDVKAKIRIGFTSQTCNVE